MTSELLSAAARLRAYDAVFPDWPATLRDKDADPKLLRDVVLIVREYLRLTEAEAKQ